MIDRNIQEKVGAGGGSENESWIQRTRSCHTAAGHAADHVGHSDCEKSTLMKSLRDQGSMSVDVTSLKILPLEGQSCSLGSSHQQAHLLGRTGGLGWTHDHSHGCSHEEHGLEEACHDKVDIQRRKGPVGVEEDTHVRDTESGEKVEAVECSHTDQMARIDGTDLDSEEERSHEQ